MSKRFQLNIYFKRNNRACMVFKRNGILYRINNLTEAKAFVQEMKDISDSVGVGAEVNSYLELKDHRARTWVLECVLEGYLMSVQLWFQSKSSGEHLDVRFSWKGAKEEFLTVVHALSIAANEDRVYRLHKEV